MSNVKIDQMPRLGLPKPQENITIQKVSRLGIPSHQLDYKDSFTSVDPKTVKDLIKDLSGGYFKLNKFESEKYANKFDIKNYENQKFIEATSTKKDNISIPQNRIPFEPKKTKEELERQIEESHYFLLSKSLSLNTTVAFIDNEFTKNGHSVNINYDKKIISYSYYIYYKATDGSIVRENNEINTSNSNNYAIILNVGSVETLFFFIEKVYLKERASSVDIIRKYIYDKYLAELNNTTDVEKLAFLYDNLPHYIELGFEIIEPNKTEPTTYKIPDDLLWKHLNLFVDYDNGLSDASYFVVKLMSLITPKFCLQQFRKDQGLVVKIYNGLDDRNGINELFGVYKLSKIFEIAGSTFEHSNKDAFISLLNTYIQLNEGDPEAVIFESSGAHFHQGIKKGGTYDAVVQFTLNSNIVLSDNKENKVEISNHWESKKYLGQFFNQQGGVDEGFDYARGYNEDGYYNPLDVVKFTQYNDKGEAITINVPAIYVKYASDLAEWEKVDKAFRLGVNILMIIGGIATIISTGGGSLLLYAAIAEVGLGYTDVIIQSEKENLERTEKGREFLESWKKIYVVGTMVTLSAVSIKAVATYGPKIVSSGAELLQVTGKTITNPEIYKKIKDLTTKAIHSIEIPNFNKTGLEILAKGFTEFAELKNARKLQDLGVIFAKGAEDTVAVVYKGVAIASGKVKEVARLLNKALNKLRGKEELERYLDEVLRVLEETGGYSAKFAIQVSKSLDNVSSKIKSYESIIQKLNHEEGMLLNNAKKIEIKKVTQKLVNKIKWDHISIEKFVKSIITHNHPHGSSLSLADLKLFISTRLNEIRAVTPEGTVYSMKNIGITEKKAFQLFDKIEELEKHYKTTYPNVEDYFLETIIFKEVWKDMEGLVEYVHYVN